MIEGRDVSSYDGSSPDYSGLDFVIIKVTEGTGYVNPYWTQQRDKARAEGKIVGYYAYPHIADGGVADATFFLRTCLSQTRPGEFFNLDWEWYGQSGVSNSLADTFKDEFLATIANKGHRRLTYSDTSNWVNVDVNSNVGDGLWIAEYGVLAPTISHPWVLWQYSSSGADHDRANFLSHAAMLDWMLGAVPQPPPPATPTLRQTRLIASGSQRNSPIFATLTVQASGGSFSFAALGVAVRSGNGTHYDFPGSHGPATLATGESLTLQTGSRDFPSGAYLMYGTWKDAQGGWHDLPTEALTIVVPAPPEPTVSLVHIQAAANRDPNLAQGGTTYPAEVTVVQNALVAEGLLSAANRQWGRGAFGSMTVAAYAAWQRRCGYSGAAANGIPGAASLGRLGSAHGFHVAA